VQRKLSRQNRAPSSHTGKGPAEPTPNSLTMYLQTFPITLLSVFFTLAATTATQNEPHIFNAIHSSLRQWGSSLNHNGMSFFMASVPIGTQLYHGTPSAEVVQGMEWLAFEVEHALVFARPMMRCCKEGEELEEGMVRGCVRCGRGKEWADTPPSPSALNHPHGRVRHEEDYLFPAHDQAPLHPSTPHAPSGYLHTYTPKHPLTLLYIDGLSAGKTSNGTLDTQDFLLLNLSLPDRGGPMGGELARARGLCDLASTLWEGKIDGVLRMEGGFEIILCDFEKSVERLDVIAARPIEEKAGRRMLGDWEYIKAIASRYHGIGGGRVALDYDRFVSVFEYEGLDLWANDVVSDTPHPRLKNASPEQLWQIRGEVTKMILNSGGKRQGRNWQEVADMVVSRYSAPLHHLHTDEEVRGSRKAFATSLNALLRPFISASERNGTLELERCISQHVPRLPVSPSQAPSLAHTTIHTITSEICSVLISALDATTPFFLVEALVSTASPPPHALDLVDGLFDYLQWTAWKECGTCADEEVCFIPIWPMGSAENHKAPKCGDYEGVGNGYWGSYEPTDRRKPGGGEPPAGDEIKG